MSNLDCVILALHCCLILERNPDSAIYKLLVVKKVVYRIHGYTRLLYNDTSLRILYTILITSPRAERWCCMRTSHKNCIILHYRPANIGSCLPH